MRVSRPSVELLGTPGRGLPVHSAKLHRLDGHPSYSRSLSLASSSTASTSSSTLTSHPRSGPRPRSSISVDRTGSFRQAHTATAGGDDGASVLSAPGPKPYVPGQSTRTALESLFAALRRTNFVELYFCLLELTRGADKNDPVFCAEIQSIPATTFSEILRCFDPVNISDHVDSAPEIKISYGAASFTPLGELVNKWGVKVLYVRIFNRLRLLRAARRVARDRSFRPVLNDYAIMLKWAGATSDIKAAKEVWKEMKEDGFADWNHAELSAEFVKARWLTENLYANHDLARLRLRPLDMFRSSVTYPIDTVNSLKHLAANMIDLQKHRFGQNVSELYFAEPLTRLLRSRKPLMRFQRRAMIRRGIPGDEKLVCAFLKANGRQGRISDSLSLLASCWRILVFRDQETRAYRIEGGEDFAPGSARAPTTALLDAVATCFGNMGEINLAVKLVDFISKRFGIPVPDKVWSDLLDFARIHQSKPASTEWRRAQFHQKIPERDTTLGIWELCTQEPHNFKPGIRDYYNLVKCLLTGSASISGPLEALRQIKPLYDEAAEALRAAWLELVLVTGQGVPNHAAYRRYRLAQSRKHYAWYCFHYAGRQMLKSVAPHRVDAPNAVKHIPDLIKEFGAFLRAGVVYHTATGEVELHNDASRLKGLVISQNAEEPRPLTERPIYVEKLRSRQEMAQGWEKGDQDILESSHEMHRDKEGLSLRPLRVMSASRVGTTKKVQRIESRNANAIDRFIEDDSVADKPVPPGKHIHDTFEESRCHPRNFATATAAEGGFSPGDSSSDTNSSQQVYVSNLPDGISSEAVKRLFGSAAPIHGVDRAQVESTLSGPGAIRTGIVAYRTAEDARTAVRRLNGFEWLGRVLKVQIDPFSPLNTDLGPGDLTNGEIPPPPTASVLRYHNIHTRAKISQVAARPAYMFRPRHTAPEGQESMVALRRDGQEFTGYHGDPLRKHFAAHRVVRKAWKYVAVPVDLEAEQSVRGMMAHLLWMRA